MDENRDEKASGSSRSSTTDLLNELGNLGAKLSDLAQSAWESEHRKELEEDLKEGLASLAETVEDGLEKIGENEAVRKSLDKTQEVAESISEKVSKSEVAQDVLSSVLSGLQSLARQVEQVVTDLQNSEAKDASDTDPGSTASDAQEIPIEKG